MNNDIVDDGKKVDGGSKKSLMHAIITVVIAVLYTWYKVLLIWSVMLPCLSSTTIIPFA